MKEAMEERYANEAAIRKWISVPLTSIATSDLKFTGFKSYTIPSVIPMKAKRVLLYVAVYMQSERDDYYQPRLINIEISTGGRNKYIGLYTESGKQYATNSENMWFPISSNNRRVIVNVPSAFRDGVGMSLFVIGYR